MEKLQNDLKQTNVAIDITKLIMAYFVVAIHTEPFGFSFWLDKGFGIFTRICVPFFFVASSYFFFLKENNSPVKYLKRIFTLYFVWSIIYLPWDISELKSLSIGEILIKYFWIGNGHALWYLCGSIVGFSIVYFLSRLMNPSKVFIVSIIFLIIGCVKSTYAPVIESFLHISISDYLGSRNGLFYAFAYYALGLVIAKKENCDNDVQIRNVIGVIVSFIMLALESLMLVWIFKTESTILWISVLPLTYNFFMVVKNLHFSVREETSYFIRKISTLVYVSHCCFMYLLEDLKYGYSFIVVAFLATIFSVIVIFLSRKQQFEWLRVLS